MKKYIYVIIACCLSASGVAKTHKLDVNITSVQKQRRNDVVVLEITSICNRNYAVDIRVSILLEGKNGLEAWGVDEYRAPCKAGTPFRCRFEAGNAQLKRPKLKAYTVEYGYVGYSGFRALDEDFYKVDSFNEIKKQNKDSLNLQFKHSLILSGYE